jgi:hypothetical protein
MKKCCFCCQVQTGSVILGLANFVLPVLAIIPLAGYWSGTDIEGLNFIKVNQKQLEFVLEDSLKGLSWTANSYKEVMSKVQFYFPTLVIVATIYAGIMALFSFLMVTGVRCEVRGLMVPFLVLNMVDIILAGTAGVVVVVALFYVNVIPGVVSALVYVLVAVFSLYSWAVVLAAYKQLGSEEYVYNPVSPVKVKHNHEYYPSAPQHFVMEEYRDLKSDGH